MCEGEDLVHWAGRSWRSCLATVHADLGASTEKLKGMEQKIVDLEDMLCLTRKRSTSLRATSRSNPPYWRLPSRKLMWDPKLLLTLRWCPFLSSLLEAAEQEVDVRSKALADLEMVSILSPDDAKQLERHEQVMLALQSSLNPDTWMDTT